MEEIKYVLVDIKQGKIAGLFAGYSKKYAGVYDYLGDKDINKAYKFDNLQDAIRTKNSLNGTGFIQPNFEIIVITNKEEK